MHSWTIYFRLSMEGTVLQQSQEKAVKAAVNYMQRTQIESFETPVEIDTVIQTQDTI